MTAFPTPQMTVNDVLRRWPETIGPLNELGVDTCCGGADSLQEAAARIGVPVAALVSAIGHALGAEASR